MSSPEVGLRNPLQPFSLIQKRSSGIFEWYHGQMLPPPGSYVMVNDKYGQGEKNARTVGQADEARQGSLPPEFVIDE